VLGNATKKLTIEDADELSKTTNFFKVYGRDKEVTSSFDLNAIEDEALKTEDDLPDMVI